jgi:NhaP-type Na+/H+ or K+/H+ antiporter
MNSSVTAATPFIVLGQFFLLGFVSVAMGVIFGSLTALMFKHWRFLNHSPVMEFFITFSMAMLCYFGTSSMYIAGAEMSGIIALLTCAIFDGHYTWHNLSQQGKTTTPVTSAFIGATMEAAIYSYIGVGLYALIPTWWSWNFILYEFLLIVIGRIIGVICTFYMFTLCCRKRTIKFNELCFITYGGMIRGAIAFALVLKIPI